LTNKRLAKDVEGPYRWPVRKSLEEPAICAGKSRRTRCQLGRGDGDEEKKKGGSN